jgi:hypothetical protein
MAIQSTTELLPLAVAVIAPRLAVQDVTSNAAVAFDPGAARSTSGLIAAVVVAYRARDRSDPARCDKPWR